MRREPVESPRWSPASFFKTEDLVAQLRAAVALGGIFVPAEDVLDPLLAAAADELERLGACVVSDTGRQKNDDLMAALEESVNAARKARKERDAAVAKRCTCARAPDDAHGRLHWIGCPALRGDAS